MKKRALIILISIMVGVTSFAFLIGKNFTSPQKKRTSTTAILPSKSNITSFVPLVKKVRPTVVKVISESIIRENTLSDLERFFGYSPRKHTVSGMGSGFFVSSDGYIVTNNHVVENALTIKIVDIKKKEYKAKKIGTDPQSDLALLKIEGKNFPFLNFGNSDATEIGEWVLAIGNPLGQELSVTSGIVSAKERNLEGVETDYQDFIQTDAAINRGNSGGPLINMNGEAIGINSAILSPSGGNVGIGFAIPSNMAKKIINDLKEKGRVIRSYMGVSIREISDNEATNYDLPSGGILVVKVENSSPAAKAGIKKYDLITMIGDKKINNINKLRTTIAAIAPETNVNVKVNRQIMGKNQFIDIKVKLEEMPSSQILSKNNKGEKEIINLGMVLIQNTPHLAREYNFNTHKGLIVKSIENNGLAYLNGIKKGDIVLGVNRRATNTIKDFLDMMKEKKNSSSVLLFINRRGVEFVIQFRIEQ